MRLTREFRIAVPAAGLLLALAGCSSSPTSTTSATSSTPASSAVTSSAVTSSAVTSSANPSSNGAGGSPGNLVAQATLTTAEGAQIGTVSFETAGTVVRVTADVEGLPPGFKGFHIHAIGKCEPNSANPTDATKVGDFLSAGGHLGASAAAHPGHQGDLSSLQVRTDGSAELVTTTDAFDMDAVLDADGSAVMVHVGPDDFGNIPTRYAPAGPDADTQATGDSGGRAACGVVEAVSG